MSQRFEMAYVVGALMVAVMLLASDGLDESAAFPVKTRLTGELEQFLLLLKEEESVRGDSFQHEDGSTTGCAAGE